MTRKLLFTVTAVIALAGCSEGSPLEPQYAAAAASKTAPPMPEGTTATWIDGDMHLAWTDVSTNERRFDIQRRIDVDGAWMDLASVGKNVTQYTDVGITEPARYKYRVRACSVKKLCSKWSLATWVWVS